MGTLVNRPQSLFQDSSDCCTSVWLKAGLDVMRFSTRADHPQTDRFVMLELQLDDGLDYGLTHSQSMLSLPLLNNAQANSSIMSA